MAVLNHTIVSAHDKDASAWFLTDVLGLDPPTRLGPFAVVRVSRDTTLESAFGPTLCRSTHFCRSCRNPFEAFKPK